METRGDSYIHMHVLRISSPRRFSRDVLRQETYVADEHKSDTSFGLDLKTWPAHAGQQALLSIQTESCMPVEKTHVSSGADA